MRSGALRVAFPLRVQRDAGLALRIKCLLKSEQRSRKKKREKSRGQREELEMMRNALGLGFARSGRCFVLTGLMLGAAALALIGPRGPAPASADEELFKQERVASQPPLEYGEFVAKPDELASVPVNDIVKSLRLNAIAMMVGKEVYAKQCAGCHGADL